MSRTTSLSLTLAVAALLLVVRPCGAVDPLAGRYEPYATYDFKQAMVYAQSVFFNENPSTNAALSWYYTSLANTGMNRLWGGLFVGYVAGETSWADYHDALQTAAVQAYYASQFAYKAYLEKPTSTSQAASGWTYYGASAAYQAMLAGAPPQDVAADVDREVRLVSYRIRAYYSGGAGVFINRDSNLDIASKHHAAYMAQQGKISDDEGGSGFYSIITTYSSFTPKSGRTIYGVMGTNPNGVSYVYNNFIVDVPFPFAASYSLGVGVQRDVGGKPYWCTFLAVSQ